MSELPEELKEIIDSEKWYPMIQVTNFEIRTAEALNDMLEGLKQIQEKDLLYALKLIKMSIENIESKLKTK